ncbi:MULTISPECIES: phosphogluconate dehydrogenase (NAD(+)-dependent, decarboxylating) [Brevibacillus]|jgi:6-phosphogluconate dehydrogenase|uniref:6-phosphogluconate dehydrogenase-like protein n=1 Tax=Brevibacillus borstelensis AK1 TaxID=1300222 RepID=M8DCZ5_9BACL|nr:decarboxylating 6-phosphogluconate dehydrogenase [Brevibacillus borstelensis]EMT51262.1 6-phosphogluconate dehydrogenase-like protein [Brevibacillus borstelensis AK1]KKX57182.1 6-phosphogluconate dehydrogenase [Brevibacillus borstelensis cifa_chp40]MCC0565126.1 decarboxylating 6-phosphogluconate dehydrogenase [Brevibacillus borstelensis]MCM3472556.1 decarboxylating 6-phosphogluconate dehydrogenase [Brevibacillus borstelensis]MCM3559982.1 decarboxylating 6-phosphogluconate dehydrogenase [Bre
MNIGLVGLGKMGLNLGCSMIAKGHHVIGCDIDQYSLQKFEQAGGMASQSYQELAERLSVSPRIIWMMVPAGELVDQVIEAVLPHLSPGDILIDGGNSFYKDSIRRYERVKQSGVHYLDIGTSGGTEGARNGACLMVGGEEDVYAVVEPLLRDISLAHGYLYTGPAGSGHFLKMVHNGIEYGMMQAIGEGFEILDKGPFSYDYEKVARLFNSGSVIRSWLMELLEQAFSEDPRLSTIKGVMHASGEGQWTVETALDLKISVPVIAMSLLMRYRSLDEDVFHGKVVAALRNQFGGHAVEKAD